MELEIRRRRDIACAGDQQAGRESSNLAGRHFLGARRTAGANETRRFAVQQASTGGMALEFGDTLPGFLDPHPGPADSVHADADADGQVWAQITATGRG